MWHRALAALASPLPRLRQGVAQAVRLLGECTQFFWASLRWALGTFWGAVLGLALLLYFSGASLLRGLLQLLGLSTSP